MSELLWKIFTYDYTLLNLTTAVKYQWMLLRNETFLLILLSYTVYYIKILSLKFVEFYIFYVLLHNLQSYIYYDWNLIIQTK